MSAEHSLVPVSRPIDKLMEADMAYNAAPQQDDPMVMVRRFHNMMRGRYIWAIIFGLVLGTAGAVAGWSAPTPLYKSTGVIRIVPFKPKLIYDSEFSQMLPMFESFVGSQVVLINSQRIITQALLNDAWKSLNRGTSSDALPDFIAALSVTHPPRSELILVSFLDPDPVAAQKAVKSVIDSYVEVYGGGQTDSIVGRLDMLERRRNQLKSEMTGLQDRQFAIAREFGTDDLAKIYDMRQQDLYETQRALQEAKLQLQLLGGGDGVTNNGEGGGPDGAQTLDRSPEQIAQYDRMMAELIYKRNAVEAELASALAFLGERHRTVEKLRTDLSVHEQRIMKRRDEVNLEPSKVAIDESGLLTADKARERVAMLEAAVATKQAETIAIGSKNVQIRELEVEVRKTAELLKETESRLEELKVEATVGGRVAVVSEGDKPLDYAIDKRRQFAVFGGFGGLMAGVGSIVLIGLLDRRLRNIYDAQDSFRHLTMLGILPRLPDDLADPDQAAMAAHCVHQIRTLLQIGTETHGQRVYTITSPASQDGKTSLSLALGLSFAASGARTLLIDCDLAGGGLSARVNAIIRRKIGQILQRQQLVTEQQIEHALRVAQESNQRLGETLIDLGYLRAEQLHAALHLQEQMRIGLLDVVDGESLDGCVTDTGIPGLSVLPVGAAEASDVAKLSPRAVARLFDEARAQYDIVVVDTGPVPGALEASQVAAESDGVVLVVSRGEQRAQTERSLEHLHSIGARVAGLVFNRAEGWDMQAVSRSLSMSVASQRGEIDGETGAGRFRAGGATGQSTHFGPVARAVAARGGRHDDGGDPSNGSKS